MSKTTENIIWQLQGIFCQCYYKHVYVLALCTTTYLIGGLFFYFLMLDPEGKAKGESAGM